MENVRKGEGENGERLNKRKKGSKMRYTQSPKKSLQAPLLTWSSEGLQSGHPIELSLFFPSWTGNEFRDPMQDGKEKIDIEFNRAKLIYPSLAHTEIDLTETFVAIFNSLDVMQRKSAYWILDPNVPFNTTVYLKLCRCKERRKKKEQKQTKRVPFNSTLMHELKKAQSNIKNRKDHKKPSRNTDSYLF